MASLQNTPDPNDQQPTDAQPSTAGPVTNQDAATPDPDPNASGNPETATQADLAGSDGAGIRGGYGNASQENGLEGGQDPAPDGSAVARAV